MELAPGRVRLAYRAKTHKLVKEPDGQPRFEWDGSWEWKHPLQYVTSRR